MNAADTTAPTFTSFPNDITMYIPSADGAPVVVTWAEPIAIDDSGVTPTMTSDHNPGSEFAVGKTVVNYIAKDESGNEKKESFSVEVIVG